jgi:hypothetical protein
MIKSSLMKWAVAAALAVPAIPAFATVHHHHKVVMSSRTHHNVSLLAASSRHHTKSTTTRHHTAKLTHGKKTPLKLSGKFTSRLGSKLTAHHRGHLKTTARTSHVRHTSLSAGTTSHFKVHVTKMPPTIDGIPA